MSKLVKGLTGGALMAAVSGGPSAAKQRREQIRQAAMQQQQRVTSDVAAARSLQEAQKGEAATEAATGRARKTPRGRRLLINPEASKLG